MPLHKGDRYIHNLNKFQSSILGDIEDLYVLRYIITLRASDCTIVNHYPDGFWLFHNISLPSSLLIVSLCIITQMASGGIIAYNYRKASGVAFHFITLRASGCNIVYHYL